MTTKETLAEVMEDLDAALTAMSEAGNAIACNWPQADKDAVLRDIEAAYLRLYVKASERDATLARARGEETP